MLWSGRKPVGSASSLRSGLGAIGLLISLGAGLSACYDFGAGSGSADCQPGERGCVCEVQGGCEEGLVCRLDRCEDAESEASQIPDETPDNVQPSPGSSTGAEPDSSPTATEPEPGPEPDTSSSMEDSTSSSSSSGPAPDDCKDGVKNAQETDVDCGGKQCAGCEDGLSCEVNRDCLSQNCVKGVCTEAWTPECISDEDCEDANPCSVDRCKDSECRHENAPDGASCDDHSSCTKDDYCEQGACTGSSLIVLDEDFEDFGGLLEWELGEDDGLEERDRTSWGVGPAQESTCGAKGGFGEDPAVDHSQGDGNGVLGMDIGGCRSMGRGFRWDCAWTAFVDVSEFDSDIWMSFWRHLHTPGWKKTEDDRGRGVQHKVVYRFQGDDAERVLELMDGEAGANDTVWTHKLYRVALPVDRSEKMSFGVCYRRSRRVTPFAGFSIDDVLVRPVGCMEKR